MDKPSFKLVGLPCGHHGQYTFYKALRLTGPRERIVAIGDFFFVRIWQDSELVSIGELQLLWTDRVSDQTLVSLRLYFLPENTPDGRGLHGEDEVLAINDKVVLRAEDLLSWVCVGDSWRWGLRAVWKGSCAPPADPRHTAPLHHTKLDFSDVEREKSTIVDADFPGVVVFSYPRYCRYRALLSRLEGIQGDWLRDSLVAALGGYAAPTKNTRILYCKDTFEYPELEGHEFVCNHLAPRLKGRPRGRRRRPPRSRSHTPSSPSPSRSSDSEHERPPPQPRIQTPRRLTLRNGDKQSDDDDLKESSAEDRAFMNTLKQFYKDRNEPFNTSHTLKDLSLRALYAWVRARGGYEAVCGRKLWRLAAAQPARARAHYERFLLPFEHYERRNGHKLNGRVEEHPITTIEVIDSPLRDMEKKHNLPDKRLKTPSPKPEPVDSETGEVKEEYVTSKPAEELNREFLESLPKDERYLNVKPFEKLSDQRTDKKLQDVENKPIMKSSSNVIDGVGCKQLNETVFVNEMQKPKSGTEPTFLKEASRTHHDVTLSSVSSLTSLSTLGDKYVNGHHDVPPVDQKNKPVGRSSLRAVRVKPARPNHAPANTPPTASLRADSASSSPQPAVNAAPPVTNFGIHHPPAQISDDEIVEVPYKPKTPEIIDLDEYPESPQAIKKKKLDILKERGLEVTAIPTPAWPGPVPLTTINPLLNTAPMTLNPAVQHQIMTQVQLFQMYNIVPPNYANGIRPPKITQGTSIFGSSGPEKTVYGNPKDPFMPPPHILHGTPVKPQKNIASSTSQTPPQDILDLTCKNPSLTPQKPAVEIVRVPPTPSPSKASSAPQNLAKNYTLIDGKAVVGSNLEITLVNPKAQHNTMKNRTPQKRSSNGKFMSTKTVTPPKDFPKQYTCPSPSGVQKKSPIVVPNYQVNPRDDPSPTSSTGSRDSQTPQNYQNVVKNQNLAQFMEMQKSVPSFMDPMYMNAFYNSLGQMDQRQLAAYRDMMASQFRGYSGLLNMGAVTNTPTTKN